MSVDRTTTKRPAINQLLERLPGFTIVVGKGGVGKTTCAIGVSARFAARGDNTLLVATDPAGSLGPALCMTLSRGEARAVDEVRGLAAMQLDPIAARTAFLSRWRDVLITIVDRGTYLDAEDIGGLVDASLPGADEIFGLLVLAQLLTPSAPSQRLVVDTAPTGHTLRLLTLPETFAAMLSLLDSMQAKHRFIVSALTRRYRPDAADEFLGEMRRTLAEFRAVLSNPKRSGAILVTRAERVVVSETMRYAEALRQLGIAIAAIVVDAMQPGDIEAEEALKELAAIGSSEMLFVLPRINPPPNGLRQCSAALGKVVSAEVVIERKKSMPRAAKRLRSDQRSTPSLKSGGGPESGDSDRLDSVQSRRDLLRTLTIVGGKGGVGKTTVSCALAIFSVLNEPRRAGDTLLVSTDPAPSIADALGITDAHWAKTGPEHLDIVPGLYVWQIDATSAFSELRNRYRDRIDRFFDALTGGIDIAHDRAILRDLLALAPPGIDELYALAFLGDAVEEGRYDRIIIDPAPTGHLLRLLELPTIALEWSHRLMRLIMKYREISGLVDAAQDLVNFSRRTRAVERLLHDSQAAGVILVSLDEPVVAAETQRLATRLGEIGIGLNGVVRNRVDQKAGATAYAATPVIVAPAADPAPIGVAAIRDWCERWRLQE